MLHTYTCILHTITIYTYYIYILHTCHGIYDLCTSHFLCRYTWYIASEVWSMLSNNRPSWLLTHAHCTLPLPLRASKAIWLLYFGCWGSMAATSFQPNFVHLDFADPECVIEQRWAQLPAYTCCKLGKERPQVCTSLLIRQIAHCRIRTIRGPCG
jgi:hypothetical protein